MRRLRLLAVATAITAVGVSAAPASAALALRPRAVEIRIGDSQRNAFVVIPGNRYKFLVSYTVAGAPRIATGHQFVFTEAVSGRQVDVATKSFPPERGGNYNESYTVRVPDSWTPGVYNFRYTLNARAVGQPSRSVVGNRSFLVVRPTR